MYIRPLPQRLRTLYTISSAGLVGLAFVALSACSYQPPSSKGLTAGNAALQQQYEADLHRWQNLAQGDPKTYLPAVAQALNNLGHLHWQAHQLAKAQQYFAATLKIERQLAQDPKNSRRTTQHLPAVASTLSILGYFYSKTYQIEQARAQYQQALNIWRTLAKHNPKAHRLSIALTLSNLGGLNWGEKRYTKAQTQYEEALRILRTLPQKQASYQPHIAAVLNNLGTLLEKIGQHEQARAQLQKALKIQRSLIRRAPAVYLPYVAATLNNLGYLNHQTGQNRQARAQLEEALEIRRALAQNTPKLYALDLAFTLSNLADLEQAENRSLKARAQYNEALRVLRESEHDPGMAKLLQSLERKLASLLP